MTKVWTKSRTRENLLLYCVSLLNKLVKNNFAKVAIHLNRFLQKKSNICSNFLYKYLKEFLIISNHFLQMGRPTRGFEKENLNFSFTSKNSSPVFLSPVSVSGRLELCDPTCPSALLVRMETTVMVLHMITHMIFA